MDGSLAKTTGVRTVTAAVAVAPLRTELRRLPVPVVGPDDGLLAVDACGLCGTDWDFYTRQRGAHLGPLILGHEIVGRVAALGEDAAKRWNITSGDRIAVEEFLHAASASSVDPAGRRCVKRPTPGRRGPSCATARRQSISLPACGAGSARSSTFTHTRSSTASPMISLLTSPRCSYRSATACAGGSKKDGCPAEGRRSSLVRVRTGWAAWWPRSRAVRDTSSRSAAPRRPAWRRPARWGRSPSRRIAPTSWLKCVRSPTGRWPTLSWTLPRVRLKLWRPRWRWPARAR